MQANSTSEDLIRNPLSFIQSSFRAYPNISSGANGTCSLGKAFFDAFSLKHSMALVPSFNNVPLDQVPNFSLVRLRCMVQDMFDPEFFLDVYEEVDSESGARRICTGRYKDLMHLEDHLSINESPSSQKFAHRHPIYVVPVPGESEWVSGRERPAHNTAAPLSSSSETVKRQREPMDLVEPDSADGSQKRLRQHTANNGHAANLPAAAPAPTPVLAPAPAAPRSAVSSALAFGTNFPLPNMSGSPCIIKLYTDEVPFKLNEIVEVMGVLTMSPELTSFDDFEADELTDPVHYIPCSIAPRIHVIAFTRSTHGHPLLVQQQSQLSLAPHVTDPYSSILVLRETIVSLLASALYGDRLAAEYLLLTMLSRVYAREAIYILGKLSLNLFRADGLTRGSLERLLAQLMPRCASVALTRDTLNKSSFSPSKNYEVNRLQTGLLQLPEGTLLLLDETALDEGKLEAKGVENLACLNKLLDTQYVTYSFGGYQTEVDANFRVVVLSEGRSLMHCDVSLPLVRETSPPQPPTVSAELLDAIRAYLAIVPFAEYHMPPELTQLAENEFVQVRRADASFTIELFHHWLTVARWLAMRYGERSLSLQRWEQMRSLEFARVSRAPPTRTKEN